MTNNFLETMAREIAEELNVRWNKGDKCNVWVCSAKYPIIKSSKKSKCSKCGTIIYYDPSVKNNFKKKHIKICVDCALKRDDLNEEQRVILNRIWCNSKNVGEGKEDES